MKYNRYIIASCITTALATTYIQPDYPVKMIVNTAVANLREIPQQHNPLVTLPTSDESNPLQITQLLLGEHMVAHEEFTDNNGTTWFKVNTLQQEYFKMPIGWHGYPGWIQANQTISVKEYPAHNIVVKNQLADIFDQDGISVQTISIGTRLYATEKIGTLFKIILPNHQTCYINQDDVYYITPHIQETTQQLKENIIQTALTFIGSYYSWGGRKSAQFDQFGLSSVDCSALVHLSFLAWGLQIPRMSHEQYLRSEKIESGKELQPGDLIFFASIKKQSARMDHVMLYLGDNQILESTFAGDHTVRIISSQERLHKPIEEIVSNDIIQDVEDQYHIYFGSFFNNDTILQKLRNDALRYKYAL